MLKERVVETNEGIQGEAVVADFDVFARHMRDMGLTEAKEIVRRGIGGGSVLEIGPGPGYLGLEWLKTVGSARLTGLEISQDMINIAQKNAREYRLEGLCEYVRGNALNMPFEDLSFDAAFSNGSLHEWEDPARIITEAYRVLKKGGKLFISDLKRNIAPPVKLLMMLTAKPRSMRSGFKSSVAAAYTVDEIKRIVKKTPFNSAFLSSSPFGLTVFCKKD